MSHEKGRKVLREERSGPITVRVVESEKELDVDAFAGFYVRVLLEQQGVELPVAFPPPVSFR